MDDLDSFDWEVFLPRGAKRSRSQVEEDDAVPPPTMTADSNRFSAANSYRQGQRSPTNVFRYQCPLSLSLPRSLPPQNRPSRGQQLTMGPLRNQHATRPVSNSNDNSNDNSFSFSVPPSSSLSFSSSASSSSSVSSSAALDNSDVFVIDLTADDHIAPPPAAASAPLGDASRGPRFAREIIDISNDSPPHRRGERSPDVLFLHSQQLSSSRSPAREMAPAASEPIDLEADVQFIRSTIIATPHHHHHHHHHHAPPPPLPPITLPIADNGVNPFVNIMSGTIRRVLGSAGLAMATAALTRSDPGNHFGSAESGFHAYFRAPHLDYSSPAFSLGLDTPDREDTESPASPPYIAPSRPPNGFTRTPDEDEVLLCPNCGDELCVGLDDVQRQVWVVRACGHVYCGECTRSRSITARRKAKAPIRTKPFKECVVDGCGQKTMGKWNMIQLFL